MILTRTEQMKFARKVLPLIQCAKSASELERIYEIVTVFQSWVEIDDNSVAFDLGEYAYESLQVAKAQRDTGWKDEALKMLRKQLDE